MTLFRQFFSAHIRGLLIWMAVGALLGLSGTRSAQTFMETNAIAAMPPALLAMYGNMVGMSPVDMYVTVLTGKGTPLIPTLYAVLLALSIVTREVDRRTVEFLLGLPVQRTQVLVSRIAVLAINVAAVTGSIWAVIRYDLEGMGFQATWGHLNLLYVNLYLLALALGALTLAISMWVDDYSVGVKLFLGFVTLTFFLEFALRAASVSRAARFWSPFSYLDITEVLKSGTIAAGNAIVLVLAIAGGVAVSFWAFNRKQFSA